MGSYYIVVNTDRREWLDPEDFDLDPTGMRFSSVDEHGANPLFYAIAYLCMGEIHPLYPNVLSGRWGGRIVRYPDDQNTDVDGMDCGVVLDSPGHRNLYALARETYKNISTDVLREIAINEPLLLVSMFRNAVAHGERDPWYGCGRAILALYDEDTDDGEWLREHLAIAATRELGWSRHQWDSLIARLRELLAIADAEFPHLTRVSKCRTRRQPESVQSLSGTQPTNPSAGGVEET